MEFFGYRKLVAYQKACEVRRQVYHLIKRFPKDEQFALCNQLRRAAVSTTSNIAEGMTRYSNKDKMHFLEISFGSLMEVMSQIEIALEEGYINMAEFQDFETLAAETGRLLSGLQKSFQKSIEILPNNTTESIQLSTIN